MRFWLLLLLLHVFSCFDCICLGFIDLLFEISIISQESRLNLAWDSSNLPQDLSELSILYSISCHLRWTKDWDEIQNAQKLSFSRHAWVLLALSCIMTYQSQASISPKIVLRLEAIFLVFFKFLSWSFCCFGAKCSHCLLFCFLDGVGT